MRLYDPYTAWILKMQWASSSCVQHARRKILGLLAHQMIELDVKPSCGGFRVTGRMGFHSSSPGHQNGNLPDMNLDFIIHFEHDTIFLL